MKRILPILILLGIAAGAVSNPYLMVLARKNAGGAAPTYVYTESFEGAGYENVGDWSEAFGIIDEDYTGTGTTDGSDSLRIVNSSRATVESAFTAISGTAYYFSSFYVETNSATIGETISLRNGSTTLAALYIRSSGNWRWLVAGGTFQETGTVSAGQQYYVWLEYTAGTGADGVGHAYISTTTTKPGTPTLSCTNGTATLDCNGARYASAADQTYVVDHILFDDAEIGNNP